MSTSIPGSLRRRVAGACVAAGLLVGLAPPAGADEAAPPQVDQFGSSGAGNGQFDEVISLAVDSDGNWYAGDYGHGRIEKFTEDGDFVQVIGSLGSGNGQLNHVNGLVVYFDEDAGVE